MNEKCDLLLLSILMHDEHSLFSEKLMKGKKKLFYANKSWAFFYLFFFFFSELDDNIVFAECVCVYFSLIKIFKWKNSEMKLIYFIWKKKSTQKSMETLNDESKFINASTRTEKCKWIFRFDCVYLIAIFMAAFVGCSKMFGYVR